jgi:hypothetical protein
VLIALDLGGADAATDQDQQGLAPVFSPNTAVLLIAAVVLAVLREPYRPRRECGQSVLRSMIALHVWGDAPLRALILLLALFSVVFAVRSPSAYPRWRIATGRTKAGFCIPMSSSASAPSSVR